MTKQTKIITIGIAPAWDLTLEAEKIDWGGHEIVKTQTCKPAGKALNVSRALAWMGQSSTAAGLWGAEDYDRMLKALRQLKGSIKIKMTPVTGTTRCNVTIIDLAGKREMHLRNKSTLATASALRKLKTDLRRIADKNSICVFAGSMGDDIISSVNTCHSQGAKIVVDTSGHALRKIINNGNIWIAKPNVTELSELTGRKIPDNTKTLIAAARPLLDRVEILLISRGKKGAILVTADNTYSARAITTGNVLSTVGCGDYLLAGFLKAITQKTNLKTALKTALKAATAKAHNHPDSKPFPTIERKIKIKLL